MHQGSGTHRARRLDLGKLRRGHQRRLSHASDSTSYATPLSSLLPASSRSTLASSTAHRRALSEDSSVSSSDSLSEIEDHAFPSHVQISSSASAPNIAPAQSLSSEAEQEVRPTLMSRAHSDDGRVQNGTETRRNIYTRGMAQIQRELDAMRDLLNNDPSPETRHVIASISAELDHERAAIESEFNNCDSGEESLEPNVQSSRARRHLAASAASADASPPVNNRKRAFKFEDGKEDMKNAALFLWHVCPTTTGSDIWPDVRDPDKRPATFAAVQLPGLSTKRTGRSKRTAQPMLSERAKQVKLQLADTHELSEKIVWPANELPSEIYYLIADYLSRDDIKAMRLTCAEFEHHLSCILFKTVVVPFNTEIYGMLQGIPQQKRPDPKGKGKAKANVDFWSNFNNDDIYTGHGVDVFRSFGSRMKRFGMSFEVDEQILANPPLKGTREAHKSYWGEYQWPYPEYKRFDQIEGMEDMADETPKMKEAFSALTQVQELALSLDSGLGWLSGPDQSIRSRILRGPNRVFGYTHPQADRKRQAQGALWRYLVDWARLHSHDLRQFRVFAKKMSRFDPEYKALVDQCLYIADFALPYIDLDHIIEPPAAEASNTDEVQDLLTKLQEDRMLADSSSSPSASRPVPRDDSMTLDARGEKFPAGYFYVKEDTVDAEDLESYPIIPTDLSKLQKEWLLETEWAQRAFLSSWLIAVVDNRFAFQHVHTLSFARLSSRFLLSLSRNDLWGALPGLQNVKLHVIPDCRDVTKDNAGFVDTPRIPLTNAVWSLQKLVLEMIASRSRIRTLDFGWVSGGEHAQGLTTRNKNVMPAPTLPPMWLNSPETLVNRQLLEDNMMRLPHIRELTLHNCWISPHALLHLSRSHKDLEHLTLSSVSLVAEPVLSNGANHQQAHAFVQNLGAQQVQAALGTLQGATMIQALSAAHPTATVGNVINAAANLILNPHQQHVIPMPAPGNATQTNGTDDRDWLGAHRFGSWPYILDSISPGTTLAASGSTDSPVNIPALDGSHKLQRLTLRSVGYARLNNPRLDESAMPHPSFMAAGSQYLAKRYSALSKVMLSNKPGITADIVQAIPQIEEQAIVTGFGLTMGWPAEWADEVEAPLFDGQAPGGTGRFHGELTISGRVVPGEA